ncbi:MAG: ABC transporter permease, partial [Mycobacteriales bacterium]
RTAAALVGARDAWRRRRCRVVGMSAVATAPKANRRRMTPGQAAGSRGVRMLIGAAAVATALSLVRLITGENDITSSGTFAAALRVTLPIAVVGLGALYAERVGIVNIGLEGMMVMGTWFGGWVGFHHGIWAGVLAGIAGGAAIGLLHAIATVTFGVDHVVSGVAINLLVGTTGAVGLARFLSVATYGSAGVTQSPRIEGSVARVSLPVLSSGPDLLGDLENLHWFLVSDLAGLLRGLTREVSWLAVICVLLFPLTWWLFARTSLGLRLRSVGEHPAAAESLGVRVYTMKYIGVVISGALAGLAGATLVADAHIYKEGQTAGRGFIGLAATIFGNWRPGGVAAGAGLFGFADALQLRRGSSVHGLLLFVALAVAVFAVRLLFRRRWVAAVMLGVLAGCFVGWYLNTETVPTQIVYMTPYVTTLVVLAFASQRLRPPAADGKPYRRGQSG